jgi:hypothetical protein
MAMTETRHGGAARGIEVALARGVDDLDAVTARRNGQGSGDGAMQDVGHDLS